MKSISKNLVLQKTMLTPVYVKMDAQDLLLLSEGVCRQLGIVSYHSQVQQKHTVSNSSNGNIVKLIQTVRLPPQKISVVAVQLEKGEDFSQMVVEPSPEFRNDEDISFGESLVKITAEGRAFIPISNPTGSSLKLEEGTCVGHC